MPVASQRSRSRNLPPSWYFLLLLLCSASQIGSWFLRSPVRGLSDKDNCFVKDEPKFVPQLPAIIIPVHNASSYVRSDVAKIVHVPENSSIEVHLRSNTTRRCQNPLFKGRISGWSLSMIDFETKKNDSNVVVGKYDSSQMPVSGTYFVEILVVLCEDYSKDFLDIYLKDQCLEDTTMGNHRITEGNGAASINIVVTDDTPKIQLASSRGIWLHKNFLATEKLRRERQKHPDKNTTIHVNHTQSHNAPPEPLFTRYQPKECMESMSTDYCQKLADRTRFDSYTFRWNKGKDEILNKDVLHLPPKEEIEDRAENDGHSKSRQDIHVCFVGASHSRVLNNKCQSLLKRTQKRALEKGISTLNLLNVNCSFAEAKYPRSISANWILSNLGGDRGCTHAVVGLFQWPFSYTQNKPDWSFSDWKANMTTVTRLLEIAASDDKLPLQRVLLRSAHPNGFKVDISMCPPRDLRSPPNAKLASRVLKDVAESFSNKVSFLDTNFVTDPVWDSPKDWSHYNLEEGSVEAKFILSEILRQSNYYVEEN